MGNNIEKFCDCRDNDKMNDKYLERVIKNWLTYIVEFS